MDIDGGSPHISPMEPFMSHSLRGQLFSQICSLMENSRHQFRYLSSPGSLALQEAFNSFSKFSVALPFWFFQSRSNVTREIASDPYESKSQNCRYSGQVKNFASSRRNLSRFHSTFKLRGESFGELFFDKILSFTRKLLDREGRQSFPAFEVAAALVTPFDNLSSEILAVPPANTDVEVHRCIDQRSCEVENQRCAGLSYPDLNWTSSSVEPKTGIEFPVLLNHILAGANISNLSSEVLVATGSRKMTIFKIKSLNVFAFGFYVNLNSVFEKLGPKYFSISADNLNKCSDFYHDLLREEIDMSVRLVVNCNGMKIDTVKDAFEKSLRTRLLKTNPDTDYQCLTAFGSYFTKDIALPAGTTIDFRQTSDGRLITEIGGYQIGVVHSKDLCRAFFDMYIGDVPVSEQTKEEIGRNVASCFRRC